MNTRWRWTMVMLLLVSVVVATGAAPARRYPDYPLDLEGELHGAAYKIKVPENWNGTLLMYAHGYGSGPVTDPDAAFLGQPAEDLLLANGYALAASGFRNAGWNVEEGIRDTQQLLLYFRRHIARPQRTIIYGASMGTAVALKSLESYRWLYDGAVPICSVGMGGALNADLKLDYTVSYAASFGWDPSWGDIGDLKDGEEGFEVYYQVLDDFQTNFAQIWSQPGVVDPASEHYRLFEFMRLVNDMPYGGFYSPQADLIPIPGAMANMMLGYYLRYELEERAGGPAAQNANHIYSLSQDDQDQLRALGMTDQEMDAMLAVMNGMADIEADRSARRYLERLDPLGRIRAPVLMLHNIEDPMAIVQGTSVYHQKVADRGNEDLLMRVYTTRPGHCNMTPEQVLTMFEAMDSWLDTGMRPEAEAFPSDQEFRVDFEPGPWPQPPAPPDLALPISMAGDINGAAYKIEVPENWNGELLVYAEGYPPVPVVDPALSFPDEMMVTLLLERGYALAASGSRGAGWNLQEVIEDTKTLVDFFEESIADPSRVILYGLSMGGDVALKSIELYPDRYDGIIPIGATGGGPSMSVDHLLDVALAYDAVFGWPEEWGEPGNVMMDPSLDLMSYFYIYVMPKLYPEVFDETGELINIPQWEFIRRVTDTQLGGYYSYEGPLDIPPSVLLQGFFMTAQIAELQGRAGGPIQQNVGRVYSLSRRDIRDLAQLGLDAEPLLATMNAHTDIEADPVARAWMAGIGDYTGEISVPVLMAHNVQDSLESSRQTLVYRDTVKAAGNEEWLVRVYSRLPGHANFTHEQMLALFDAMDYWLDTGRRPHPGHFPRRLDLTQRIWPGMRDWGVSGLLGGDE